jgi:hypothetical protein
MVALHGGSLTSLHPHNPNNKQDEEDRAANRHLLHALANVITDAEGHAEVRFTSVVDCGLWGGWDSCVCIYINHTALSEPWSYHIHK